MRKQGISKSSRQCVVCCRHLAWTDQSKLYFLPSPWTHFLALGLVQWKKKTTAAKGECRQKNKEGKNDEESENRRVEKT